MPLPIQVANSAANLAGKNLLTAEDGQVVTGQKTFDRDPNPPFAVAAGSAAVPNLDADKLDGEEGAAFHNASNLNAGTVPGARIPNPLPAVSGEALVNLNAQNLTGVIANTAVPNPLPAVSGTNLTNLDATDLVGVIPNASVPNPLPAVTGVVKPLASFQVTVGNVGIGEDDLASKVLAAGLLSADGHSVRGIFWGKTANNANVKTLRVRVIEGANDTLILAMTLTVSEAGEWALGFEVKRSAAATARTLAQAIVGPANGPASKSGTRVTQPVSTWANAVTVKVTGEATADNDITLESGTLVLVS